MYTIYRITDGRFSFYCIPGTRIVMGVPACVPYLPEHPLSQEFMIVFHISIAVEGVLVIMVCWFARSAIKNELRRLKNKLRRPKNKLRRPKNIGASFRFMGESNAAGASSGNATQATTVHL